MLTEAQEQILKEFWDTNPNEFQQLKFVRDIFFQKKVIYTGKENQYRRIQWICPDTVFFNYSYGLRDVFVSEGYYNCPYILVYYGTIDDSYMRAWLHLPDEPDKVDQRKQAFDKIVRLLHLGDNDDEHFHHPVGLTYVNLYNVKDYLDLQRAWEKSFSEMMETYIRPILNYHIEFDYN